MCLLALQAKLVSPNAQSVSVHFMSATFGGRGAGGLRLASGSPTLFRKVFFCVIESWKTVQSVHTVQRLSWKRRLAVARADGRHSFHAIQTVIAESK